MLHEQKYPSDNRVFRKWSYAKFDGKKQVQHTEDRYEILLNGEVVKSEHHRRSPALRWYTQNQAMQLYQFAGFKSLQILNGFEDQPALEHDIFFTIVGTK